MSGQAELSLRLLQRYDFCLEGSPSELRGDLSCFREEPDLIVITTISNITQHIVAPRYRLSTLHRLVHLISNVPVRDTS